MKSLLTGGLERSHARSGLTLIDADQEVKRAAITRGIMLRRDLSDLPRWSDSMTYWDGMISAADEAFGSSPHQAGNPWRFDPDKLPGVRGSDGQVHPLSSLPLIEPGDDPADPHYQLHDRAVEQLKDQLREVNAALAVSAQNGLSPMLWAPYAKYMDEKARSQSSVAGSAATDAWQVTRHADAARLFFEVAFPRYAPKSIRELGRIRGEKAIQQLRAEIVSASETGDVLDPTYPQRVLEEVFNVERDIGRRRTISGWLSSAAGLLPLPGAGPASAALSELVGSRLSKKSRKDTRWFYLLSNGEGNT